MPNALGISPSFVRAAFLRSGLAGLALMGVAHAQFCFEESPMVSIATPRFIAAVDIELDGDLDFVIAETDFVRLIENRGDGTFRRVQQPLLGGVLGHIALADLDGDQDSELIVGQGNSVAVYWNQSPYSFAGPTIAGSVAEPSTISTADLDGDGDQDLLATATNSNVDLVVIMNLGAGSFAPTAAYPLNLSHPPSVTLADLDGDGDVDFAGTGFSSSTGVVLLNQGNGTFVGSAGFSTGLQGESLASGDLDGDGDVDLALLKQQTNGVLVLWNQGNATFPSSNLFTTAASPRDLACADLDHDGIQDIVIASQNTSAVSIMLGLGSGTFAPHYEEPVGFSPWFLALADVDEDGTLDVATAEMGPGTVTVLYGRGDGQFRRAPRHSMNPSAAAQLYSVVSPDLDNDSHPDLAVTVFNSNVIELAFNRGDGTFEAPVAVTVDFAPWEVISADVDADGDPDLITTNAGSNSVSVVMNLGARIFAPQVSYPVSTYPEGLTSADLDGDGDLDLAVACTLAGTVDVLLNQGNGTFVPGIQLSDGASPCAVAATDLDGDGDIDLFTTFSGTSSSLTLSVRMNLGNATFAPKFTYSNGGGNTSVTTADLENDGDADVIVGHGENVFLYKNPGNGQLLSAVAPPIGFGAGKVRCADLDGDGRVDLAIPCSGSASISLLRNIGNAQFASHQEFWAGLEARGLSLSDFDADGSLDIAVVCKNRSSVGILLHCSTPPQAYCFGDGTGVACPCAGVGAAGNGCPNSALAGGARFAAAGYSRVSNDSLVLTMTATANAPGLFIQGTNAAGLPFGDGVLCVGGGITRLAVVFSTGGSATLPNATNTTPIHTLGGVASGGGTRHYQAWYRDAHPAFCTAATFNFTNGLTALWAP